MRENGKEQVHKAHTCSCLSVIGDQTASGIEQAAYIPSNPTKAVEIVSPLPTSNVFHLQRCQQEGNVMQVSLSLRDQVDILSSSPVIVKQRKKASYAGSNDSGRPNLPTAVG